MLRAVWDKARQSRSDRRQQTRREQRQMTWGQVALRFTAFLLLCLALSAVLDALGRPHVDPLGVFLGVSAALLGFRLMALRGDR
jgi:hypothetical protein